MAIDFDLEFDPLESEYDVDCVLLAELDNTGLKSALPFALNFYEVGPTEPIVKRRNLKTVTTEAIANAHPASLLRLFCFQTQQTERRLWLRRKAQLFDEALPAATGVQLPRARAPVHDREQGRAMWLAGDQAVVQLAAESVALR